MEPRAIDFGVGIFDFWDMTMREIIETGASAKRKKIAELKERAEFDYKSAQLNMYAFNDPKKMPKKDEHYSFLKEFKNLEVEFVKEKIDEPAKTKEPEKPEWMIHKEIIIEQVQKMNADRARKIREQGGEP